MSKKVKSIREALDFLKAHGVEWLTVNKIENSLWETGVAFFNKSYYRIAYYDEVNNVLLIN